MTSGVYIMRSADGRVLYVGMSVRTAARIPDHIEKHWWSSVATIEVRHTDTREAACVLEKDLIKELLPVHNVVGKIARRATKKRARVTPPHVSLAAVRSVLGLSLLTISSRVTEILEEPVTPGALSAIENGHRGASPETLRAIEIALGLRDGDLAVDYEPSHTRRPVEVAS